MKAYKCSECGGPVLMVESEGEEVMLVDPCQRCIDGAYDDGYADGHDEGHEEAYNDGYEDALEENK